MTKINPDKSTSLKFKIALQGAKEAPSARLIIQPEGSSHFIGIPADINEDMITVKIPARYEHFTFNEAAARLEVIVGQDYFVPWRDDFIIEESFKLEVTPLTEASDEETKERVSVTIVEEEVEEPAPVEEKKVTEPVIPPAPEKKVEPVEENCGKKHKKVEEETDDDDETMNAEKEEAKVKKKRQEKEAPKLKEKVEPHKKLTGYL